MKYWEIARLAIEHQDAKLAEGLLLCIEKRLHLRPLEFRRHLIEQGIEIELWDELVAEI